ncbi:MAG: hypothetical protein AAGA60_22180 [Cyanobacteria bacterium P01_E01_bin.42]
MAKTLETLEDYESLRDRLRKSQIVDLLMKYEISELNLEFTHGLNDDGFILRCLNVIHFIFSKDLDDRDGCYFVGNIFVKPLKEDEQEILKRFNYEFLGFDEDENRELIYIHVEGGILLEIVCEKLIALELNPE